jgi:hypothetical protein
VFIKFFFATFTLWICKLYLSPFWSLHLIHNVELLQVSLHLICIKDEVDKAWPPSSQQQGQASGDVHPAGQGQNVQHVASPFVSEAVLEVIGNVLRPETGAPPELPAQIDSVSSVTELSIN